MRIPNTPFNERERLAELDFYKIIGEIESDDYDFLTQMAAQICNTKIALISLITEDKQWFLSHHGLEKRETPREISFCGHAINQPNEVFIVEDALKDTRFFDNPLVTGVPNIVFYAGMPLVSDNGFPLGTICVADDVPHQLTEKQITSLRLLATQVIKLLELRRKTHDLKAQNNQLKKISSLFNESQKLNNLGAWELDLKTGATIWTEEVYHIHEVLLDFDHNQAKGIKFYHPEDRQIVINAIENTAKTGKPFDICCRLITAKNNLKWVRSLGKAWKENGQITKLIGNFQDITHQKEKEEILRISEETFRGNFEHAAIGMALLNEKGEWIKVNKKLCEILGYTENEILKQHFQDLSHPEDLNTDKPLLKEITEGKRENYSIEKKYIHKNGQTIYVILAVSVVKNIQGGVLYFISQIIDITARKNAQIQLSNTIAYNQAIMDASTQVMITSTNTNGVFTTFNEGAERLLGYTDKDIIGKETPELIHIPEEIAKVARKHFEKTGEKIEGFDIFVNKAKKGIAETNEWTYKRKDGSTFPVLLSVSAIKENGLITGFLGIATDISQMKKVENETKAVLDIAKSQNEKLKNFAYIVSHNLRSHSAGIASLIELIEMDSPEFSTTEFFDYLKKSSENLSETIKHLTQVVQINLATTQELETVLLKPIIDNNISSLFGQAKKSNVRIINEVNAEITVDGIPAYLDSIIMNFLTNAIKYKAEDRDSYVKIQAEKTKKHLVLKFSDNGLGINLEKHGSKIFGMYKTFHSHADSKGIGLFITKNQIEAMGGKIEIESQENVGTTFKIYLQYEKN